MSKVIVRQIVLDVEGSNVLKQLTWNSETRDLSVLFTNFSQGVYKDIPSEIVGGFLEAESAGSYLHHAIKKDGKYKYERIT